MSAEHPKRPKGPVPEGVFDGLVGRVAELTAAADVHGIKMAVALQNGYGLSQFPSRLDIQEVGYVEQKFAASHAKLAVGAFAVARLDGIEDSRRALVERMLRESDDEAMRLLVADDPEAVNEETKELADVSVEPLTIRPDGTYFSGMTTAADSMKMLAHLLRTAKQQPIPYDVVLSDVTNALANNTSRYGVRRAISPTNVRLLNKTGDYYGHNDKEVGEAVHHDTGVMYRKVRGGRSQQIAFGITTSSDSKPKAVLADHYVGEVGREIASVLGAKVRRPLAARALHFFAR